MHSGMQPTGLNVRSDVLPSSALSAALEAYLDDDLEQSLQVLAAIADDGSANARQAVLLKARAFLRLQRPAEVLDLLGPRLGSFVGIDEAATAAMLHAIAVTRVSSVDRGIDLLHAIKESAQTLGAHKTIRAEITYWLASAYWRKREFPTVLRYAREAEAARADVISVRAATLRGYVASASERYGEALALFRSARDAYTRCRERDVNLLERIVVQVASLEVTLRSARCAGTHDLPPEIARVPLDCPARGNASHFRMQICAMDAWLFAFDGERRRAYRLGRLSEALAPTEPWRAWALANRANIALAFGDVDVAATFADHAFEIARKTDWNKTTDEERVGLLFLTEALVVTDPQGALDSFQLYLDLTTEIDRSLLFSNDVRLWIVETFVQGLVHRINKDWASSWQAFKSTYEAARRVGFLWRAALALIEIESTPNAHRPRGDSYLQAAALLVHQNFPRSFLSRRLGRWSTVHRDPVASRLAPQPREVLRHLLSAKSTRDIADAMGLSEGTVRNYIKDLFRRFNVRSREELLVACYERGIGSPSWWDQLQTNTVLDAR